MAADPRTDPTAAVQAYLNDLLHEAPSGPAFADDESALASAKREQLQALLDRRPWMLAEQEPQSTLANAGAVAEPCVVEGQPSISASPDTAALSELGHVESPLLQWCQNGRPNWAQTQFDVLLCQVSGLTLAVPLVALGQIFPIGENLAPIFGQAPWFMGLLPTPNGAVRTVNTALLVMPERYDPASVEALRYVISIDGLDWGLAVDAVRQPTRLAPQDVTWRTQRSKRPWLAGTVKSEMCALLDIPRLGQLLQQADRARGGSGRW